MAVTTTVKESQSNQSAIGYAEAVEKLKMCNPVIIASNTDKLLVKQRSQRKISITNLIVFELEESPAVKRLEPE